MTRPDDHHAAPETDAASPTAGAASDRPTTGDARTSAAAAALGSLSDLPVAGLTRRRIALALGALVAAWVIVLFAHQVGEASDASARAEAMRASNVALEANVGALQQELDLIQRQSYIEQQARQYRLGSPREVPFALADGAPALPADAPGSAGVRLGAVVDRPSPLDSWLRLLFGPGGDPSNASSPPGG
jgi:cell division protein FtsB